MGRGRVVCYGICMHDNNMGNSLVRHTRRQLRSQHYEWTIKSSSAFSTTVMERGSGMQGQRFTIDYSLLEQEWRLYILRNRQQHLVGVMDILQERQDTLCATNREVAVVIEAVPYRLSDLGGISFPEGMYVLHCILSGYRLLTGEGVGFYLLDETAICFTKAGVCKFWINQNLQLARPNANRLLPQGEFVNSLLEIVEMRMGDVPGEYLLAREQGEPLTCSKLLSVVERFREGRMKAMPSISAMQPSPQSTKYHHHPTKPQHILPTKADQKVSVSKWRRHIRRGQGRRKEGGDSSGAKISLSFSKSHRQDPPPKREGFLPLFVSPRKGYPQRSMVVSAYSSRDQSRIHPTCPAPSLSIL